MVVGPVVVVVGGLLAVVPIGGLVGGLLRLLPFVVRGPVEGVGLVVDKGVDVAGRLDVVRGRFGGMPLWHGGVVFSFPESAACSPPEVTAVVGSSGAVAGTGVSTSVLSIMATLQIMLIASNYEGSQILCYC